MIFMSIALEAVERLDEINKSEIMNVNVSPKSEVKF